VLANYSKAKGRMTITDSESLEYLSQRFESIQSLKGDTLDEKLQALRDCITMLSDHERQCVELRYAQNFMPAELSDRLGVALETIKKRLLRAKQRLVLCITSKMNTAQSQEAML
jgi:RNA polymerase sigma factor (sigma-70 family)